jgi:hypothetical protein
MVGLVGIDAALPALHAFLGNAPLAAVGKLVGLVGTLRVASEATKNQPSL